MTTFAGLITVSELHELIGDPGCRVVDCRFNLFDPARGRQEYLAGHIPGAVHADMDKDLASEITGESGRHPLPDAETFCRTLGDWGIGKESTVIAYDQGNGSLAARLWWMLRFWLGHQSVAVLNGGISAWDRAGGDLEPGAATHEPATYVAVPDNSVVATTSEITAAVGAGDKLELFDAREAPRFNGDMEPIDAVAGHIPGARNMPVSGNVNEDGTWRNASDLARIWDASGASEAGQRPIVMCGSGVTACHLILSAELTGRPAPRLYVGSWSEWIRDGKRPISTSK